MVAGTAALRGMDVARAGHGVRTPAAAPTTCSRWRSHLANALLVYVIGLRILRSPWPALFAGVLFGASSIAFTPLHWTSCIVELLVTTFSLSAFALYLSGRDRGSNGRLALGALLGLMALLSKESAILFPLVLLVAHLRLEPTRAPLRQLVPQAAATALYAIGFVATLRFVHYIASEAYARSFAPVFLAANFTTYLDWIVALNDPIRDAFATAEPSAWVVGIPVALALAAVLWTQRREPRHPEEVGAAWFLAFWHRWFRSSITPTSTTLPAVGGIVLDVGRRRGARARRARGWRGRSRHSSPASWRSRPGTSARGRPRSSGRSRATRRCARDSS